MLTVPGGREKDPPHMKIKLTDRLIRTRRPPAIGRLIIADTAVPGLRLRINPASTKNPDGLRYWLLRYGPRQPAERSAVLGPYPALSPAEARRRSTDIGNATTKGIDLLAEEQHQVEERRKEAHYSRGRRGRSRFRHHIYPARGNRLIGEIRRADVVELLARIQHDERRRFRSATATGACS
jgi:Arm DNA-binding domain